MYMNLDCQGLCFQISIKSNFHDILFCYVWPMRLWCWLHSLSCEFLKKAMLFLWTKSLRCCSDSTEDGSNMNPANFKKTVFWEINCNGLSNIFYHRLGFMIFQFDNMHCGFKFVHSIDMTVQACLVCLCFSKWYSLLTPKKETHEKWVTKKSALKQNSRTYANLINMGKTE